MLRRVGGELWVSVSCPNPEYSCRLRCFLLRKLTVSRQVLLCSKNRTIRVVILLLGSGHKMLRTAFVRCLERVAVLKVLLWAAVDTKRSYKSKPNTYMQFFSYSYRAKRP